MFNQLIDYLNRSKNWLTGTRGVGFFKEDCRFFSVEYFTVDETDATMRLLKKVGLSPHIVECDGISYITLSEKEFQSMQNQPNNTKRLFTCFKNTGSGPSNYGFYNDVTDDVWDLLSQHIWIKTNETDIFPPQTNSDRKRAVKNTAKFIKVLKENIGNVLLHNHLIYELAHIYQSQKDAHDLVIDITDEAQEKLERIKADGMANYSNNSICISNKKTLSVNEVITISMHEIRHILQSHYLLQRWSLFDHIYDSSCQDYIRMLAIEAEAKGYSLLNKKEDYPFVGAIYDAHIKNVEKDVQKGKIKLPKGNYDSVQTKLTAITRFVRIEAEKRTLQTLCNVYLARNRFEAFQILKNDNAVIQSTLFNEMMNNVDEWKNYYFRYYKMNLKTDDKFLKINNQDESKKIEKRWKKTTGMRLNLSPASIFTPDVALELNIYSSIYGQNSGDSKELKPRYLYVGVTPQLIQMLTHSWETNNYDKIASIYEKIQKKNPFLPPITSQFSAGEIPSMSCGRLMNAMKLMGENYSISTVFRALGYDTRDYFDGSKVFPVEPVFKPTEQDMHRIMGRVYEDVKITYNQTKPKVARPKKQRPNPMCDMSR